MALVTPTGVVAGLTVQPVGRLGFDVLSDGRLVAPIRLAADGGITADNVQTTLDGLRLSGFHTKDPLAATFGPEDYVSITLPATGAAVPEPVVRFQLTLTKFDSARWKAMYTNGAAPFHFLTCSMPSAQVWHQRGWLNATPNADPFPLLQDVHVGSPEISSAWNRNWSYICPLGGHPIPMIGAWDPSNKLYVGYDFQGARATDQSERYLATAYCWQQGTTRSFISLAFPHGGSRFGELVYPQGGETIRTWFHLVLDTNLPDTEDPNERFQARLFERYADQLPEVPAMNDMAWMPGTARRSDFAGPNGLNLFSAGGETTFYPAGTLLMASWGGHREMPVDTSIRRGDLTSVAAARNQINTLLATYAKTNLIDGDTCVFWEKPLSGAWLDTWGGAPVTTLHNTDAWYPARVLVEIYRYDRSRNQADPVHLKAIDGIFNWTRHFVWTRNEFADVPSSPFAIGGTLSTAFLLDYYFTFRDDAQRKENAELARDLAGKVLWRYLQVWAMDSDRYDGAIDGSFLAEPNSGRDWAALACANEVNWLIDSLTQVYVHTGDPRMRYYLRGMLQRWPQLYRPLYEDSLAAYGNDSLTEGFGLFDGSGPGRGERYSYGFSEALPFNEPVGSSRLRVIAGTKACVAFSKYGTAFDVTDYRTDGRGACAFKIVSSLAGSFDVSFSHPFVDISKLAVTQLRSGQLRTLSDSLVTRPTQAPSSLYLRQLKDGDVITIGTLAVTNPVIALDTPRLYSEANVRPVTRGSFATLDVRGTLVLTQDWTDLHSFAGLVAGERWVYGIPYQQRTVAVTNEAPIQAAGAGVLIVAYAPPEGAALSAATAPRLILDDGSDLTLSGKPFLAWRAWPPIFVRQILMDYAKIPPGRTVQSLKANGALIMAATAFSGTDAEWTRFEPPLVSAGTEFARAEAQRESLLALQQSYAALPAGKIAVLPLPTGGAGGTFAAQTGLKKKWTQLTEAQLVDTNYFTATRFPVAFFLGGEPYVKTVSTDGDGKAAIVRYLNQGGTLVLLASGPFPMFYGYGPADKAGPSDPLMPALGLPIENAFEQAPANMKMTRYTTQNIVRSVANSFAFPPGDPRLRDINRSRLNAADRYIGLVKATDAAGRNYGDAAGYIEFKTGPAKGGKILYIWSSLLAGPDGAAIMADAVTWVLDTTLRQPNLGDISLPDQNQAVIRFDALPAVSYGVDYRERLDSGAWTRLQTWTGGLSNRVLYLTNATLGKQARFFRLVAQP